jgi:3-phenylpropionate/trans-cinnamate dioxygenase ferredoxin subunit
MADWVKVAETGQVGVGELLPVEVGDTKIVLANVDGTVYALLDQCSHEDLPLSSGFLEGDRLECVWHGAQFDACSGRALSLPAIRPVKVFQVDIQGTDIRVDVS